jgi:4-hydroxy-3-polyprenylbenzoate decarboxylase
MAYKNLADFLKALEAQGELVRVAREVSPVLEIAEIADRAV